MGRATSVSSRGYDWSEIEVLGYRGIREYALGFDGMRAPADALLGAVQGAGFKQLTRTFEGAHIQTAVRAVGVAHQSLEIGLDYAVNRKQFGKAIIGFPRVAVKITMGLVDRHIAGADVCSPRARDLGRRCDKEAGMAKLLAARSAWANTDGSLQIHGDKGYALEFEVSRLLCDARILNIFEGAAKIQARVIARGGWRRCPPRDARASCAKPLKNILCPSDNSVPRARRYRADR